MNDKRTKNSFNSCLLQKGHVANIEHNFASLLTWDMLITASIRVYINEPLTSLL